LPYVFRLSATHTALVVTDGTAAHRIAEHTNAAIQDTAPNVPTTNIARREILGPLNENLHKLRGLRSNQLHTKPLIAGVECWFSEMGLEQCGC